MLGLPKLSSDPVLFLPLWLGTLRDHSGYGNHQGIQGIPYWSSRGGIDTATTPDAISYFTAGHSESLAVTDLTIFVWGQFDHQEANTTIIRKIGALGRYQFRFATAANIDLFDGVTSSSLVSDTRGSKSLAVTLINGQKPQFYKDGIFEGEGNDNLAIPYTDGQFVFIGPSASRGNYAGGIIYPTPFLAPEIAELHDYSQSRITPRRQWPGSGLRYPDRERNELTPTPAAAWTPANNPLITDIENGIRIAYVDTVNPEARQTATTPNKQYMLTAEARGDGVGGTPLVLFSTSTVYSGSPSQTWDPFSIKRITDGTLVRFRNQSSGGYVEFRNIKLWEVPAIYEHRTGDPLFLDNIQTARVTLVDQTSGRLSNTPYQIESGTWALREDAATGERYIQCVAAGFLSRRNLFAYGTWEFELRKLNPNAVQNHIINSNCSIHPDDVGYFFHISTSESVQFYRDEVNTAHTSNSYVDPNVRYTFRVTRRTDGQFTLYLKGGAFVGWTLVDIVAGETPTNPFTDNVNTTSLYVLHDLDAGDRLYYDNQFADVLAPV